MQNNEHPIIPQSEMKLPVEKNASEQTGPKARSHVLGILAGASLLLIAGFFIWYKISLMPTATPAPTPLRPTASMNNEPESTTAEAQVESFGAMSTSNELDAIEADLESTNLDSLESELIQINAELEAALQ
jgi:hypothetical protein